MNKVKERMRQLKDALELAEQREMDAKTATREVETKLDVLEGEKTTLISRINVMSAELDKINERLYERSEKLDVALERSEESEVRRKQLAETEVDDFERSEEAESTLKAASVMKEDAERMAVEAERKVLVLEGDLARAHEKHEKFVKRIVELTEEVTNGSQRIRVLEEKDRDASEREDINEEKAKFLETQVQETLTAAETLERQVGKLERLRDQLGLEIDSWIDKREEIRREMEEAMGSILDDVDG